MFKQVHDHSFDEDSVQYAGVNKRGTTMLVDPEEVSLSVPNHFENIGLDDIEHSEAYTNFQADVSHVDPNYDVSM